MNDNVRHSSFIIPSPLLTPRGKNSDPKPYNSQENGTPAFPNSEKPHNTRRFANGVFWNNS
jgi:hypothetical protein